MTAQAEHQPRGGNRRGLVAGAAAVAGLVLLVLAFAIVWTFGDPRPRSLDLAALERRPFTDPATLVPGRNYYRIRADLTAPQERSSERSLLSALWRVVATPLLARTKTRVTVTLASGDGETGVPLLQTEIGSLPESGMGPLRLYREGERIRAEITVAHPAAPGWTPLFVALGWLENALRAIVNRPTPGTEGPTRLAVVGGADATDGTTALDRRNRFHAITDPRGRVIAVLELGLEMRDSILFPADFMRHMPTTAQRWNPRLVAFVRKHADVESRVRALETMIDANLPEDLADRGLPMRLRARLRAMLAAARSAGEAAPSGYTPEQLDDADRQCRSDFETLEGKIGLGRLDAALVTYLLYRDTASFRTRATLQEACGKPELAAALIELGAPPADPPVPVREIAPEAKAPEARQAAHDAAPGTETQDTEAPPSPCVETAGAASGGLCRIVDALAAEWRSGTKLLAMAVSRRYLAPTVALEEPSLAMRYEPTAYDNRRKLLVYLALSRVEHLACFRQIAAQPPTLQALMVIREPGPKGKRRIDVVYFVFDGTGRTVIRLRRRPAMQSDLDAAETLPAASKCRRRFLAAREAELRRLVAERWRLPLRSG